MNHTLKMLLCAGALAGFVLSAQAVPLTGSISFTTASGTWSGNGDINTITQIDSFGSVTVDSRTGSFTSVAVGTGVTMGVPFVFATPFANNPLWSVGGYSFNLTSFATPQRNDNASPIPDTLVLSGSGVIQKAGFDDTPGGWTWSGQLDGAATFSFSSTTAAGVPDGGVTVAFLGAALIGLAGLRRKLNA